MTNELDLTRRLRCFALAAGLTLAGLATPALAQDAPPPPSSGVSYAAPDAQAADGQAPDSDDGQQEESARGESRPGRRGGTRGSIRPYLEVSQTVSADLDGGETLTYTSLSAGVDGTIRTRRVTAQASYRYERNIEWEGNVADRDVHSGIATVNAQIIPGTLSFDAGAMATRTGGDGRALGVTNRDAAVNVYSAVAGPSLSARAGPLAVNASYRLGYVKIDDDRVAGTLSDDFDESVAHSATASVGMGPGGALPFGWTVGAGYAREDSGGRYDNRFEGAYVRADVVIPVSATLAVTAGVGYENIQSSERDIVRDGNGDPVLDAQGRPIPDPDAPRVLGYDMDGFMYDAGIIWRPGPRTELQARAGRRYGGTTVVGTLGHRFNEDYAVNVAVVDSVETLGRIITNDLTNLPDGIDVNRDPITGDIGGCVFGQQGGGVCLGQALQSITSRTFRMRGANIVFSGSRRLWNFGLGASYVNRRYSRPSNQFVSVVGAGEDQSFNLFGSIGRQLSRSSNVDLSLYASWYDNDLADFRSITSLGGTVSYNRSFVLDRLRLIAAMGLYNNDDGFESSTNASGLLGLRYTFW